MSDNDGFPTAAEQARFEQDQQDPAWLEWLTGTDTALATFFAEDVLGMPTDPYTSDGLRQAELAAAQYFPTSLSPDRPAMRPRAERFARFIGETFRRNFGGRWCNVVDENGSHPEVEVPGFAFVDPMQMLKDALWGEQDGSAWVYVFTNAAEDHADWAANGRLPAREWFEFKVNRRMSELDG